MSSDSSNLVQNKVITEALYTKLESEEVSEMSPTGKVTIGYDDTAIWKAVNNKINKENDDYYPNMSVGVADNLSGVDVVASEFTTRQSGGGAILDGTARIEAIKGNSIVWNQKLIAVALITGGGDANNRFSVDTNGSHSILTFISDAKQETSGNSSRADYMLDEKVIPEHKYLFCCDIKTLCDAIQVGIGNYNYNRIPVTPGEFCRISAFRAVSSLDTYVYQKAILYFLANPFDIKAGQTIEIKNVAVYDLTKMFGVGNEPTTIDEFYARMPIGVDPMLYNKGQMINLIPSGIKSYSADEEPIERFQDLSLIGTLFPDGMKSVGEFHDEIRYNKETQKWEKITRIGEVDLGSLDWSYANDIGYFYSRPSQDIGGGNTYKNTNKQVVLINSADFTGLHWTAFTDNYVTPRNNAISLFYTPDWNAVRANILCNEYTDAASFKEYLQGKKAYFVLNDPIVEELEFDGNLDYQVWNGGTEEVVPYGSEPTTPLKANIAYGFNAVGKIKELEDKINSGGGGGVSKEYVDTKVTELSEEVGTLSERVDELGKGGSSVFEAVFGKTTYEEIVAAANEKKHIICFHKNRVYNLCNYQQGMDLLFTCAAAAIYLVTLKVSNNSWVESQYDYEIAINKVTTINADSSNLKYPSAKAVYDFVQTTLGTIINGEY